MLSSENNKESKFEKVITLISRIILELTLILICAYFLAPYVNNNIILSKKVSVQDSNTTNSTENINNIASNLKKLRSEIDELYLGEIDERKIFDEALKGYVKGVGDKYTSYYTKDEWKELNETIKGEFYGVGIYMELDSDESKNINIVSVVKQSPAQEAGILSGDILIKVNDEEVNEENFSGVTDKIRGQKGTKVKLTILRENEEKEFLVERREIKVEVVTSRIIDNNIGYIKIDSFTENAYTEFEKHLKDLKAKGMKKLILDVRNNTGGELTSTHHILENLLPEESVMYITKNKKGKEEVVKNKKGVNDTYPIVVLVNEYSASASEVLTGALADKKNATVVGTKTYGKGVIQQVQELSNGGALKVTIEEYLRPTRVKINEVGITPHVEVKLDKKDYTEKLKNAKTREEKDNIIDNQLEMAINTIKERQ